MVPQFADTGNHTILIALSSILHLISPIIIVLICEDEEKEIECQSTQYLNIVYAMYGSMGPNRCTINESNPQPYRCFKNTPLQKLKTMCDKRRNCSIQASNNEFAISEVKKYLMLRYECKHRASMYTFGFLIKIILNKLLWANTLIIKIKFRSCCIFHFVFYRINNNK